jgi:DNA mismatch repair protein MutL
MVSSIQPLKTEWVYRMAAGEVIDSLAAVVRELIDNALDANATRISIDLWPQQQRVQVADNGMGLSKADLSQAALPHTTSKLDSFNQLNELQTLGFRGEALHSIAQLGQLEICSRTEDGSTGWRVVYNTQGAIQQVEEIAIAPGSSITVSNLFANWPSRQQAFAKPSQVLHTIQSMVGDYALCHPEVTWQVRQNHRPWFSLAPSKTPKDILLQIVSKLSPDDLNDQIVQLDLEPLHLLHPQSPAQIELILGLPDRYHRHRSDWLRVAVNGRRVYINTDSTADPWVLGPLEQSILNAFRQTLPRHRYPLCWTHLKVPSELVDWNRTAAKSHVYLHHLEFWKTQLNELIRQTLDLEIPSDPEKSNLQMRQLLKSAESQGKYFVANPVNLSSALPDSDSQIPDGIAQGALKAIAQLHQTYILAEHPTGLWLVEQHIAHERVLYEGLCRDWQRVELETPIMLSNLSERQILNLEHLSLGIESFGQNLWVVRTAPQILVQRSDCTEALYELSQCANLQTALVATACRSAIRNGKSLDLSEMQVLLNQWQQTQHPRTCPHGRPIYLGLDEKALSRFFRRHWVIGKSHGI